MNRIRAFYYRLRCRYLMNRYVRAVADLSRPELLEFTWAERLCPALARLRQRAVECAAKAKALQRKSL